MHQGPHRAFTSAHDCCHFCHAEVRNHPQEHRFRLIGGEPSNHFDGVIERSCALRFVLCGRLIVGTITLIGVLYPVVASATRADVIDSTPSGNREQPAPEVGFAALETSDAGGDIDPDDRGEIVGIALSMTSEIPQYEVVVGSP